VVVVEVVVVVVAVDVVNSIESGVVAGSEIVASFKPPIADEIMLCDADCEIAEESVLPAKTFAEIQIKCRIHGFNIVAFSTRGSRNS
jgi:predicted ABC-type ATPase